MIPNINTHEHTHTYTNTHAHTCIHVCAHTHACTHSAVRLTVSFVFHELTALSRPAGAGQESSTEQEVTLSSRVSRLILLP